MSGAAAPVDPKGLVREAFRIPGITAAECRSIFLDWALSLPEGVAPAEAAAALLALHAPKARGGDRAADHPMLVVLGEAAGAAGPAPRRRGGSRGRRAAGDR